MINRRSFLARSSALTAIAVVGVPTAALAASTEPAVPVLFEVNMDELHTEYLTGPLYDSVAREFAEGNPPRLTRFTEWLAVKMPELRRKHGPLRVVWPSTMCATWGDTKYRVGGRMPLVMASEAVERQKHHDIVFKSRYRDCGVYPRVAT